MNAGKATALLQVAHNYEAYGKRVELFTSAIDDRFGLGTITSRLGPNREARTFDDRLDFFKHVTPQTDLACLLVDEAQFLSPKQVRQLHRVAHVLDVPAICIKES